MFETTGTLSNSTRSLPPMNSLDPSEYPLAFTLLALKQSYFTPKEVIS